MHTKCSIRNLGPEAPHFSQRNNFFCLTPQRNLKLATTHLQKNTDESYLYVLSFVNRNMDFFIFDYMQIWIHKYKVIYLITILHGRYKM